MIAVVARRLARLVPVIALVSVVTFLMLELVPGDPAVAVLGTNGTPEQYDAIHRELGLDKPLPTRYWDWLSSAAQGDFGKSLVPPHGSVADMIFSRLPVTLEIATLAMIMALAISVPLGLWSAYRAGRPFDRVSTGLMFGLVSMPSFLLGLVLIVVLVFDATLLRVAGPAIVALAGLRLGVGAVRQRADVDRTALRVAAGGAVVAVAVVAAVVWPELPRQGFVRITDERGLGANLRTAFLPALTLALTEVAVFTRLLRNDVSATLQEDFILSARAKGMPVGHILIRDALRPSSFSLLTIAGVSLGRLLGGTVIVETLFQLPGVGTLMVDAINAKDFRVVQATVLLVSLFYVALNAAVDIAYAYLDPRVRRG